MRWVYRGKGKNVIMLISKKISKLVIWSILVTLVIFITGSHAATIDVTAYGANGNDTIDDTGAIRSAVAALTDGDTLLFPEATLYYKVAVNANFQIRHKDNITIIIRSRILAQGTPVDGNYVFDLYNAHNITFVGETADAILEGPDIYDFDPGAWNDPCLIYISVCNNLTIRNLTFKNGPQMCILLGSSKNVRITDCLFEGGPTVFDQTHIHGILFTGVNDFLIARNRFKPRADGGKAYSWICSGSTSSSYYVSIINNRFQSSFDHSLYTFGIFHSVIANNTFVDCEGSAVKTYGAFNIIANNHIYNTPGGIEIRDSQQCVVANNTIDRLWSVGIIAHPYGSPDDADDNLIEGNLIRYHDDAPYAYEGIRVWGLTVSGTKIIGNTIIHANHPPEHQDGSMVIRSTDGPSYNLTISGNTLAECGGDGIYLYDIHDSIISDNIIDIPVGRYHFDEQGGTSGNYKADNLLSTY